MKIGVIGHKRIPGREGGIEVVVEELATRMATLGYEIIIYNRRKKGLKLPKIYKNARLVTVPTIEKKNTDAVIYSFLATIRAILENCDVIHYHAIGPGFFVFIPYLFKIRTVVTVHGLNYKTPKWNGIGAKFIKAGETICAKYADEIIVLSQQQQNYFRSLYGRETTLIPNGTQIYDIIEPNLIKEKFGLEKDSYILFLSRIVPGKGLEYLLEAYRKVDCNLKLVIAGDSIFVDDFYIRIQKMAAQDTRVKLIGFVEGKILQELYSNTRLFVFPSEAEGMPICLLEALSYNCNCLVSDIPENLEVGKGYVHHFKSCDVNDLAMQLKISLDTGNLKENSRKYIEENYSWDEIVKKTLVLYGGK